MKRHDSHGYRSPGGHMVDNLGDSKWATMTKTEYKIFGDYNNVCGDGWQRLTNVYVSTGGSITSWHYSVLLYYCTSSLPSLSGFMATMQHVTLWFLRSVSARLCFTLYGGKFEGSLVEWLNPFCLHCNVCFLKAVLLQQIFHLQKMLPIIFRQQLDLTMSKEKKQMRNKPGGWRHTAWYLHLIHMFLSV